MPIKLTIFGISKTKKRYPFSNNKIKGGFFMNLIIPEELALFSKELQRCLSPDVLETLT
jgi:hypothetical protein